MTPHKEAPKATEETQPQGGTTYRHPAYGTVVLSSTQVPAGTQLFGSGIPHSRVITIGVYSATLGRHLSRDWVQTETAPLVEFEMSHAQFAQFITSQNRAEGTPVTLTKANLKHPSTPVPGIQAVQTKHQEFHAEIKGQAAKHLAGLRVGLDELNTLVESGRTSKTALRGLLRRVLQHAENLPSNMAFVVTSAEDALDKATSDAKIEIEAYLDMRAKQLGLEALGELQKMDPLALPENQDAKPKI